MQITLERARRLANGTAFAAVAACFLLFKTKARLPWLPPPITVERAGRTAVYSWEFLVGMVVMTLATLVMAATTKVAPRTPDETEHSFDSYFRVVLWIAGVGGCLAIVRVVLIITGISAPP